VSESAPASIPDRLRWLIEEAKKGANAQARRPFIVEGLLNFGAEFVTLVSTMHRDDSALYDELYHEMFAVCRDWLSGESLSSRSDEDARRARFALWFCSLMPGLARIAARLVYRLPEGHPDRDLEQARKLLLRQFELAVQHRIPVASALDAIGGLLQLQLISDDRAVALIASGERILTRAKLSRQNDNFRVLAVLTLHQLANRAEARSEEDTAAWLREKSKRIEASLEQVETPARDELLVRSLLAREDPARASRLRDSLLTRDGVDDDIQGMAAQKEADERYQSGSYRAAIDLLSPLLPELEERYLTAIEPPLIESSGAALANALLRIAYSHARLDEWKEALHLLDRAKSLRLRYEQTLRRRSGAVRALELQAMLGALDRGLDPDAPGLDIDPRTDPVGAKLSLRSRMVEAFREYRGQLVSGELEGVGIEELAGWLTPDEAALILAESADGILGAIVTARSSTAPFSASIMPAGDTREVLRAFVEPGSGWLVTIAAPELVTDPSASLGALLEVLDAKIAAPVAAALSDTGITRLVVIPHSFLHLAPYWALPSFAELDVTMVASAYQLLSSTREPIVMHGRALIASNPTLDLPTAESEAATIAGILRRYGMEPNILAREEATEDAMNEHVCGAALLHFAGHGRSDVMRPLQSALEVNPGARGDAGSGADRLLALAKDATFTNWKDNERMANVVGEGRLYERIYPAIQHTEMRLEYATRGTLLGEYVGLPDDRAAMSRARLSELWTAEDLITQRTLVDCRLAFLSSCEVGQGGIGLHDEYAGLPAALQLAGVHALVCPLWRVDDVASAVFATVFYEELFAQKGTVDLWTLISRIRRVMRDMKSDEAGNRIRKLASSARRATQRFRLEAIAERIEREGGAPFKDPMSWAAFQASGNAYLLMEESGSGDTPHARQGVSTARAGVPSSSGTENTVNAVRPLFVEERFEATKDPANGTLLDNMVFLARRTRMPAITAEASRLLYERAQRRTKRKQLELTREDYELMLELDADDARAHAGIGSLALAKGDLETARASLNRALSLDSSLVAAHRDRGHLLLSELQWPDSIGEYTVALELEPDDYDSLLARGLAWTALRRNTRANSDFLAASQRRPDEVAPYLARAAVLVGHEQADVALDLCNEALALQPEEGAVYLQRAAVYIAMRDGEKAFDDCETALLLSEDQSAPYTQKGYLLAAHGMLDDALEALAKALEVNPDFKQAYFTRACAFSLNERSGTILDDLRRAIDSQPQFRLLALASPELEWARQHVPGLSALLEPR
jgi:tetratricopeptide (TPR) repeat protein/CHAT domain-containing protein